MVSGPSVVDCLASVTWDCDVREEALRDSHRTQHEHDAPTALCATCAFLCWACCTPWRRCLEWGGSQGATLYGAQSGPAHAPLSPVVASVVHQDCGEAVACMDGLSKQEWCLCLMLVAEHVCGSHAYRFQHSPFSRSRLFCAHCSQWCVSARFALLPPSCRRHRQQAWAPHRMVRSKSLRAW